jgi:hypothetical protein
MLYAIGSDAFDAWQMRDWQPTSAILSNAGYSSHQGENSMTYEAYAAYRYEFQGQHFNGSRVWLSGGADNIGSYQTRTGNQLRSARNSATPITVYVNPASPGESIIDRDIRWAMIGFRSIFVLLFGGFGLGMMIFVFKAPREKDPADPRYADSPWLANDDWQSATIRSDSKSTMYATWGFAVVWNLISAPLPFVIYAEVLEKQNTLALVGLLFPLVGAGLIAWAIGRTREWHRFGPTPVTLDPFPGSIGGHVGGTIDLRLPYDAGTRVGVTLTNLESYMSGSGKNRRRSEKALWQDSQSAQLVPGSAGTRLTFRFDVPASAAESDAEQSGDSYHLWRLNIAADLPGADLDRDFDVPVYATATESRQVSARALDGAHAENRAASEQAASERFRVAFAGTGKELLYPMGRNALSSLGGIIIGGLFAGAGVYLMIAEGERFIGGVFSLVGGLIFLASLYMLLNSLHVKTEGGQLISVRRILGIPISRRSIRTDQVQRFSKDSTMQTQSGRRHVMHYSIYAGDDSGQKICVGEGFTGESEANAAIRLIARELSVTPREGFAEERATDAFDALAADR